jgi:hypothetical protein
MRTSRVLGPHGSQAEISQAAFHRYLIHYLFEWTLPNSHRSVFRH